MSCGYPSENMVNIPPNHKLIIHQGISVAVVVPYDEYIADYIKETTIPHEVAYRVESEQISLIRAWREYFGLTQAELATRMNMTHSIVSQIENNKVGIRQATLKKIALALGLTVAQIKGKSAGKH